MAMTRRQLLRTTAATVASSATPRARAADDRERKPAAKPLRILVLGGTGFIGPHQVRHARERGHVLTLFNRGRTNPGLFPDVETLHGDRAVGSYDLAAQKVRPWIDLPVWLPPHGRTAGFARRCNRRALAKGLTFRPLADTTAATLAFYEAQSEDRKAQLRAGLAPAREKEVLAAWHARENKS